MKVKTEIECTFGSRAGQQNVSRIFVVKMQVLARLAQDAVPYQLRGEVLGRISGDSNVPRCIKWLAMRKILLTGIMLALLAVGMEAFGQRDTDEEPTSDLHFLVLKEDSGKPVRNASVIMHPVNTRGKQGRGGLELKTDPEGKSSFEGIPYGKLRVQVLATGFQTYGEDFEVNQPKMTFTIKLKRPQGQYSIYDDHSKDPNPQPKQEPPPEKKSDKPN
jgi:hypothetical protein